MSRKRRRACLVVPVGLVGLCLLLLAASAASNLGLPTHSATVERLNDLEKARLSEVLHLRTALGDAVWPGWAAADIPLIVYNEKYAFLVGYQDPPAGWLKMPIRERRGGAWEQVPGDSFEGKAYYRTVITDPAKTPEGFSVLVGERWTATFQTREYGEVSFYQGFRQGLPPVISGVVPVRLGWQFLMGKTDSYIAALEHESFHAYEGMLAPQMLAAAERSYAEDETYPYAAMDSAWRGEMDVLVRAVEASDETERRALVLRFLDNRRARRVTLSREQIEFERLREWEEGLAKYAELEIARRAEAGAAYQPVDAILRDSAFQSYTGQAQFWRAQLSEATRTQGRSGDTRFYYSGNALAILLDQLLPDWKRQALPGGKSLDELLQIAVGQ